MNVLIIEDEIHTAQRLEKLITQYDPQINVVDKVESVEDSIQWFQENKAPDLIFQDIELSDGNCFQIYDTVDVDVPIIFTTAYSEYALKSFQLNSIDYVLKPYDLKDIKRVIDKFISYGNLFQTSNQKVLKEVSTTNKKEYKQRFLINIGDQLKSISIEQIAFIKYEDSLSFIHLFDHGKYPVDKSITTLETELDPTTFFRVNRKYIIHVNSISKINTWFNSRLQVEVNAPDEEIIVSRDRVKAFKEWLDL
ncbi:LytR/AlgR family response regulator transcription factor [Flammeovirga agarivorans]|uniref:Response regulator transcription factor n=1 Tax=Flammeovirga agarivorans TaxID=2726742 RepID=A0A7X8SGX0_9BACT|nr:LytTR family DNA-binding domain-containing protein [Flammeovirga agarivorans]NLR90045.1 response regulator transcription factor [Flammeovirga agarivorans]